MNRWQFSKEVFVRDTVPVRYEKLSRQLTRIAQIMHDPAATENSRESLTEAMVFIEWIAPDVGLDWQVELLELQRLLARWKHQWETLQSDYPRRQVLAEEALDWANRTAKISEVLQFIKEVA